MAISKKIAQLTALALKDRVLTYVEKKTIVNAALAEGISEQEITNYLNNAIKKSLKNYTKEQLKRCPFCGGQIPLISDDCLFCGNSLKNIDSKNVPPVFITGNEAEIIKRENFNTAEQQKNLKTCPDCGAPFPLISNICLSCGHILHEQTDSALNIKNLLNNINTSLTELKNAPHPTFVDVLIYRKALVLLVLAALFLIVGFSFMGIGTWAGFFFLVSLGLLFLSFLQLKKPIDNNSPVKIADDRFYNALHQHEMYLRQVSTLYGDNAEARQLLDSFDAEIEIIKKNRAKKRRILTLCIIGFVVLIILLPMLAPSDKTNYEINRIDYKEFYQVANLRASIKPNPYESVDDNYSPYFTVASDGELSVDVLNFSTFIGYTYGENPTYRLRLANVKLQSTGRKITNTDTVFLRIIFWDKDFNVVGRFCHPAISTVDYYKDCQDNIYSFLEKGRGTYYADFVTRDSITNYQRIKDLADSACYFTIF